MLSHSEVQAAISARIDGEEPGLDPSLIDAHIAQCPECNAYWERSLALSRSLGLVEKDGGMAPPRDLTDVIVAGVEDEFRRVAARRMVALSVGRVVLVALAGLYLVWAGSLVAGAGGFVPANPGVGGDVLAPEADPQAASFMIGAAAVRIGIAAALMLVAWKPGQIPGVLLIVGAMFGFTVGFAVLDAIMGGTAAYGWQMLTLFVTCAALVFMWVADKGPRVTNPIRAISADPRAG